MARQSRSSSVPEPGFFANYVYILKSEISISGVARDFPRRISVWRLNKNVEPTASGILELVHQEMLPPARSFPAKLFVSENYFVAFLQNWIDLQDLVVEVRSTANFSIFYTVKESVSRFNCFKFSHDLLTIQVHRPLAPAAFM